MGEICRMMPGVVMEMIRKTINRCLMYSVILFVISILMSVIFGIGEIRNVILPAICSVIASYYLWLFLRARFNPYAIIKKCGTETDEKELTLAMDKEWLGGKTVHRYEYHNGLTTNAVLITEGYIAAANTEMYIAPTDAVLWAEYHKEVHHSEGSFSFASSRRMVHYLIFHTKRVNKETNRFSVRFDGEDEAIGLMGILKDSFCFPVGENRELGWLSQNDYYAFETHCRHMINQKAELRSLSKSRL